MRVGGIDTDDQVLVIAEIGNNHEGSMSSARALVEEAAAAGADAVKFQTFVLQHFGAPADVERYRRLATFELSFDDFAELAELARSCGLLFISTPLDVASAHFLAGVVDCLKVASGDNDFYPLLAVVARAKKPLLVSTGFSDLAQLDRTVAFVEAARGSTADLALAHCVGSYPAPDEEVNLRAIGVLAERFPAWTIGYSDHTRGVEAATLSVAAGARVVEKHFTLDKCQSDFRDHALSADPQEFRELVRRVRIAETFAGRPEKTVQQSETANAVGLRRSVVAARDLRAGHRLADGDLTWHRPAGGLEPGREQELLGKTLRRDASFGERIQPGDVA